MPKNEEPLRVPARTTTLTTTNHKTSALFDDGAGNSPGVLMTIADKHVRINTLVVGLSSLVAKMKV